MDGGIAQNVEVSKDNMDIDIKIWFALGMVVLFFFAGCAVKFGWFV